MSLRVTSVRVNHAGVRRMLGAPFMQRAMGRQMEPARLLAIVIAPVLSGHYKSRFERPEAIDTGVNERGAAFARLSNDAKSEEGFCYALALEVGTEKMKAQRILRRALAAVGR